MPEPSWTPEPGTSRTLEENWLFRLRRERFRSRESGQGPRLLRHRPGRRRQRDRADEGPPGHPRPPVPRGLEHRQPGAARRPARTGRRPARGRGPRASRRDRLRGKPGRRARLVLVEPVDPGLADHDDPDRGRRARPRAQLDESEELSVELHPAASIPAMIRSGAIDHALAVGGLLLGGSASRLADRGSPDERRNGLDRARSSSCPGSASVGPGFADRRVNLPRSFGWGCRVPTVLFHTDLSMAEKSPPAAQETPPAK